MRDRLIGVTGATGFIGRHLVTSLKAKGYRVRALVRRPWEYESSGTEVRRADLLEPASLPSALQGIDTAYYLVHSMMDGPAFADRDKAAAENFLEAAEVAGVERVIYLGGLGETGSDLSRHLTSRAEVGRILASGKVPTTTLRAAIILGHGGASWEMLRQLVERLPVMVTPKWVEVRSQPIALRDVLAYLRGCLEVDETVGRSFDIGGPDILTYREMMLTLAEVMKKRRYIFGIPVLTPRLSSYWVDLVTDVPSRVARPLIDGLKNEVVCRENHIQGLIPTPLTSYREAIRLALRRDV